MTFKIRPAQIKDLPLVDELQLHQAQFELKYNELTDRKGKMRYNRLSFLSKLIKSPRGNVWVAEDLADHRLIGCCLNRIELTEGDWSKYKYTGWIEMVFVGAPQRNHGVGTSLIRHSLKWFKTKNIRDIRLTVYPQNTVAVNLYKGCGFKPRLMEMISHKK